MLNVGSSVLPFVPYQIYYSEERYNNLDLQYSLVKEKVQQADYLASADVMYVISYYNGNNVNPNSVDYTYLETVRGSSLPYNNGVLLGEYIKDKYDDYAYDGAFFKVSLTFNTIFSLAPSADFSTFDFNVSQYAFSSGYGDAQFYITYLGNQLNGEDNTLFVTDNLIYGGYGTTSDYKYNGVDLYLGSPYDYLNNKGYVISTDRGDYVNGYIAGYNDGLGPYNNLLEKVDELYNVITQKNNDLSSYQGLSFNEIKQLGVEEGSYLYGELNLPSVISKVFHGPIEFIDHMLDFNFPGTSVKVLDIAKALFSISLVFVVLKFIRGQ